MGLAHSTREYFQTRLAKLAAAGPDAHGIHCPDSRLVEDNIVSTVTYENGHVDFKLLV
jgi:hypothetical protein